MDRLLGRRTVCCIGDGNELFMIQRHALIDVHYTKKTCDGEMSRYENRNGCKAYGS